MFKKLVSLICVMIVSIFCFGIAVSAEIIAPCTLYTDSASSTLTISETTATCSSTAKGYANVTTKIVIKQTLITVIHIINCFMFIYRNYFNISFFSI